MVTEELWKAYRSRLLAFIRGRISDPDTAEDIVQDIFARVHTGLDGLRDSEKAESWLLRSARNAVIDHYRRKRPTQPLPEWTEAVEADDGAALSELSGCVAPMLGTLPEIYRRAVQACDLDGLPQAALAERERIGLSGAKSRVQRGRDLLKKAIMDCCELELNRARRVVNVRPRAGDCDSCG